MVITGTKRTRIIREWPPEEESDAPNNNHWHRPPNLAHRVRVHSAAGLSIHQIAAKLGISKSVVVLTLAWLRS